MTWSSLSKISELVKKPREKQELLMNQTMMVALRSLLKPPLRRWLPQELSLLVLQLLLVSSLAHTPLLVYLLVTSYPVSKLPSPNPTPVVLGITPRRKSKSKRLSSDLRLKKKV